MRKALLIAPIILLAAVVIALAQGKTTLDPNTVRKQVIAPLKDDRLDQKVIYKVKLRQISDLTNDLTDLTGITFYSGRNLSDWRVREDCATVIASDIPLSTLMESIAHAMHFRWIRSGKFPNWTYRLVEDQSAIAEVKKRAEDLEKKDAEERKKILERYMSMANLSGKELEKLRDDDPEMYVSIKSGMLQPTLDFLNQAPEVADAWVNGRELRLNAAYLSPAARQAAIAFTRSQIKYYDKVFSDDQKHHERCNSFLDQANSSDGHFSVCVDKCSRPDDRPFIGFYFGKKCLGGIMLQDEPDKRTRLLGQISMRAYENNEDYWDVYQELRDQIRNVIRKEAQNIRISSYSQDVMIEHSDDPTLECPLKSDVSAKSPSELVASLSDASGFAMVADSTKYCATPAFKKDSTLRKSLDTISMDSHYYNWNRNDKVIELWDANWYEKRLGRIPNAMRERLRKKMRETGTLEIDELAEIASLTDEQFRWSISEDNILRYAVFDIHDKRDYLKMYASLTPSQRSMMFSDAGLAYESLTADQKQSALKLLAGENSPLLDNLDISAVGARIMCSKECKDKRFIYTFTASTRFGEIPGKCCLKTPLYVDPKSKSKKKVTLSSE